MPLEIINTILTTISGSSDIICEFIKKTTSAIGIIFEPARIRRNAKAEVDVDLIHQGRPLGLTIKQTQAMNYLSYREKVRQENYLNIVNKAIPYVSSEGDPSSLDPDWLNLFFDMASRITNDEMQTLWAKILAGETNNSGSFSRQTLVIVDQLSKDNAQYFTQLGSYCLKLEHEPTIFMYELPSINETLNFSMLLELESLGLLTLYPSKTQSAAWSTSQETITLEYFEKRYLLNFCKIAKTQGIYTLPTGKILLTTPGRELIEICGAIPNFNVLDSIVKTWDSMKINVTKQ